MNKDSKIYVTGHNGLVGSALVRKFKNEGYTNVIHATRAEVNLLNTKEVYDYFDKNSPEYVINAAARVGGIHANDVYAGEFIYENLQIQNNIITACHSFGVKKFCFLGSVCIYPKYATVPVQESELLNGQLESSNQWYAIAKIAGIKMCQAYNKQYGSNFISVMPTNLYGENDNFHPTNSHVIPGLIRRFVEAKETGLPNVTCWGTGSPRREFMYVDDVADAILFLMNNYDEPEIINIGWNKDYTIKETANMIKELVGYDGELLWDDSKPDGTPKRMMDSNKINQLGWKPSIDLKEGLQKTIEFYLHKKENESI